ncbi:MAG TPA: hypothetical protein VGL36_35790 [Kribbella sp.]
MTEALKAPGAEPGPELSPPRQDEQHLILIMEIRNRLETEP